MVVRLLDSPNMPGPVNRLLLLGMGARGYAKNYGAETRMAGVVDTEAASCVDVAVSCILLRRVDVVVSSSGDVAAVYEVEERFSRLEEQME
jgi:tartrate dehydratase alpha subunit/fumarate hydratase class I-like protein